PVLNMVCMKVLKGWPVLCFFLALSCGRDSDHQQIPIDSAAPLPVTEDSRPSVGDLFSHAEFGSLAQVKEDIQSGVPIDSRDSQGDTPLLKAIKKGHQDVAFYLMAQGADVYLYNNDGLDALTLAVEHNLTPLVKSLFIQHEFFPVVNG